MLLDPGDRLGPYEIQTPLGAGGMGEVYRAHDTKLGRDVAIKTVSDAFGHDPDRVARFQREAHLLAALNHPHIAAIHGLEEANGSQFLVLELVEGETLAERLKTGPLPVSEALTIARQIADALQAAHEKGIIHRDLKPANIAFTADGQVKVLDFGLAKALEPEPAAADLSNSPTMTLGGTQAGVILGTAAYMAPEQAKGRTADKRSDVWAFGCVLYEMLAGKRAFDGEDVSDTLAAVLRGEPNWSALPRDLSQPIRILLKRCLEKDRAQRIADVSTANFVLIETASLASMEPSTGSTSQKPLWLRVTKAAAGAVAAALATGMSVWFMTRPAPLLVSRLQIAPPAAAAFTTTFLNVRNVVNVLPSRHIAITPDGTHVIYAGANDTLFLRPLDQLEPIPLRSGGRPAAPFVSPDARWIGFGVDSPGGGFDLMKVAITGGPAVKVTTIDAQLRGATWGMDDTIVFATSNGSTGLQRVSAGGGEPSVLTRPGRNVEDYDHFWPEFLPGGEALLFTIVAGPGNLDQAQIAVLDLRTGTQTRLLQGSDAHYVPTGHLIYGAAGSVRAVGFDLDRLTVVSTPVPVVPEVKTMDTGAVDVGVASQGTLVYVPGTIAAVASRRTLVWVDRKGQETAIPAVPPRVYASPRLSPDGTKVALDTRDGDLDIVTWDFGREILTRLTFDANRERGPVWSADGSRVAFESQRDGKLGMYWQSADGTGVAERIDAEQDTSLTIFQPKNISPDGRWLLFYTQGNVNLLDLQGDKRLRPLVRTSFDEGNGVAVSRDGRWIAYDSNESGRMEIYVRPFPEIDGGRWQISTNGGTKPVWSHDRRELFYLEGTERLMAVPLQLGASFSAGRPQLLFDKPYALPTAGWTYDVSPDGQRFLMLKSVGESDSPSEPISLVVVQHFDEELKRLVPTK